MKIWLFALIQAMIAVVGVTAYFYAEIPILAGGAAVLAALVGIAQPLMTARKQQRLERWQQQLHTKSVGSLDTHVGDALEGVSDPPVPHRGSVEVLCREASPDTADALLARYDEVIAAIQERSEDAERGADCLAPDLPSESLGHYLCGLGALAQENDEAARDYFSAATAAQSSWVEAWLGWAAACYRLEEFHQLSENHPHTRGVDLLPYDCGSEHVLLQLPEEQRAELNERFRQSATGLGNYLAVAEMMKSRKAYVDSREDLRKIA